MSILLNLQSKKLVLKSNQKLKLSSLDLFCWNAFGCCFRSSSKVKWSELYLRNFFLYFILILTNELIWTFSWVNFIEKSCLWTRNLFLFVFIRNLNIYFQKVCLNCRIFLLFQCQVPNKIKWVYFWILDLI